MPTTVKQLLELCREQVKMGNGDKTVLITCDDEGNGVHVLYYDFTTDTEDIKSYLEDGDAYVSDMDPKKCVILG